MRATWWAALISKILAPICACIAFYYGWSMMGVLFLFILFVGDAEYKQTLRLEQEEQYWRAQARLAAEMPPYRGDEPPLILHGPN